MRKYILVGLAIVIIAFGAIGVFHLIGGTPSSTARSAAYKAVYHPGRPVPATAAATARDLVSGTGAEQRAALSPTLAAVLPHGTLFPAGSTITLNADSWQEAGGYANATGTLSGPGASAQQVEIGFISSNGTWFVTFEEPLS
jgi:hypothetical protein